VQSEINFEEKFKQLIFIKMKKITIALCLLSLLTISVSANHEIKESSIKKLTIGAKLKIKIKNDTDDAFTVYNANSGGSYRLQKGTTTAISMDEGDKLYGYEGGKKGALLLTASADMDGKVQMLSKL
jgi:hypothetical protein